MRAILCPAVVAYAYEHIQATRNAVANRATPPANKFVVGSLQFSTGTTILLHTFSMFPWSAWPWQPAAAYTFGYPCGVLACAWLDGWRLDTLQRVSQTAADQHLRRYLTTMLDNGHRAGGQAPAQYCTPADGWLKLSSCLWEANGQHMPHGCTRPWG